MTTETPPRGVPLPPPEQLGQPDGQQSDSTTEATGTPARRSSHNGRPPTRRRTAFTRPDEPERDWRSRGTCNDHDPELWFSSLPAERHRAMMLCYTCPVLATCRSWAEDTHQPYGVWGGLDFEVAPEQRADGTDPGKPAAARVPLLERVAAVLDEYPGAAIDEIAERLGYKNAASLERTLYRRGPEGKAMIRKIKPGSRDMEDIRAKAIPTAGHGLAVDRDHPWLTTAAIPVRPDRKNAQRAKTGQPPRAGETSTGTEHAA